MRNHHLKVLLSVIKVIAVKTALTESDLVGVLVPRLEQENFVLFSFCSKEG